MKFNDMVKSARYGVSKNDSSVFLIPHVFDYPRTFVADSEVFGKCVFELDLDSYVCATYHCGAWEFGVNVDPDIHPSIAEKYGGINYTLYNTKTHKSNYENSSLIMRDDKLLISRLPIMFSEVAGRLMDTI